MHEKMKIQHPKVVKTVVKDAKARERILKRRDSEIKVKDANILEA